jgi:hypothetical protein
MAFYGNILTVYNTTQAQLQSIVGVLTQKANQFEQIDTTFFIETSSKANTREIIKDINDLGVQYIFYHNSNADGSYVKAAGLAQPNLDNIEKIMFE